jgi:hypothetical protein
MEYITYERTVVIFSAYHLYLQLRKFYPTFFCLGLKPYADETVGDHCMNSECEKLQHAKNKPHIMLRRVHLVHLGKRDKREHKENKVHVGSKESPDHLTFCCC